MKYGHFIFESILITCTILFGSAFILNDEIGFGFAIWWQMLGILQVTHSLLIGSFYWNQIPIRVAILLYWFGVALNFVVMYFNVVYSHNHVIDTIVFFVFPTILALYLWFITGRYRQREIRKKN